MLGTMHYGILECHRAQFTLFQGVHICGLTKA